MTDENQPSEDLPHTVSMTFRDLATGKNVLKIISTVSLEDKARFEEDSTGELVGKYIITRVLHELRLDSLTMPAAPTPEA